MSQLSEIIQGFRSHNTDEQNAAEDMLRKWSKQSLTLEDGIDALKAAAQPFPPRSMDWQDSSEDLIKAVAEFPLPEYIPVIIEHFPLYSANAKMTALWLLAKLPQREAAVAFMHLLRGHGRKGEISRLWTMPLRSDPRHGDVFFPEILSYSDVEAFQWDINLLLLCYLDKGSVLAGSVSGYGETIIAAYADYENKLMPLQQSEGIAWMWDESYQDLRNTACLYLDLLGFFPSPSVTEAIHRALSFTDPRLVFFAIKGLIHRGENVPPEHLFSAAASAETRNMLYDILDRSNKSSLFPQQFRTQTALAESDMVSWLIYPTELGCAPDEIELMHVATIDTEAEEGLIDYYVFRFRTLEPHWGAKDGWMAGVSGPFIRKNGPSTDAQGCTFSRFDAWESQSVEEHLDAIVENIEDWGRCFREERES
jgi:hypothetical protein